MIEWLNELAHAREAPLWAAFALGLLTAIAPCPLATNITATAFIAKGFNDRRKVLLSGLLYTLGRAFSYTLIGLVIYFGASKFHLARFLQGNGERFLAPVLIFIGLVMLDVIKLDFLGKVNFAERFSERLTKQGLTGSFLLGILFALAFCPYSGVLYFGSLIPMTVASSDGLYLPVVFAFGTGLPVLIFTYLLAFSMEKVGKLFHALQQVERYMRTATGIVFVLTGVYYALIFLRVI